MAANPFLSRNWKENWLLTIHRLLTNGTYSIYQEPPFRGPSVYWLRASGAFSIKL